VRDHEIFQKPRPVDLSRTVKQARPKNWSADVAVDTIEVLPLHDADGSQPFPGWVSYESTVEDSPDVEIFCGGVNDKPTIGAALWRQGHLLHFGFDLAPHEMNANARALLVNSIAYIARFRGDQALCRAPSAFAGGVRARGSLAHWLDDADYPVAFFTDAIAPELLKGVPAERAALRQWFAAQRDFLRPGADGRLTIDPDAQALGLPFDRIESIAAAIEVLAKGAPGPSGHARAFLPRYVPEGPGTPDAPAGAAEWSAWFAQDGDALFYSEWGGYRWYVDRLAQARGVPSAKLRGSARAER